MSDASTRSLPWVRLGALLVVLSMTALPFVSCGPLTFQGHELLRNTPPSDPDLGLGKGLAPKVTTDDKKLFDGDDQWIWFSYLAGFGLALAALFLGGRGAVSGLVGLLGLGAVIAFLVGFNNLLKLKGDAPSKTDTFLPGKMNPGVTLELGAYLALGAFAGIAADGYMRRRPS